MPTEFTFRLRADPSELTALMESVHSFSEDANVPLRAAGRVALVVEELVSNAIKYGYETVGTGTIMVRIRLAPGGIELTLEDDGRHFDPFTRPALAVDLSVEHRAIGGLGLHLVRSITAARGYRRTNECNCVVLTVALND